MKRSEACRTLAHARMYLCAAYSVIDVLPGWQSRPRTFIFDEKPIEQAWLMLCSAEENTRWGYDRHTEKRPRNHAGFRIGHLNKCCARVIEAAGDIRDEAGL